MLRVRLRIWDYTLIGATFWILQIPLVLLLPGPEVNILVNKLANSIKDTLVSMPERFQIPASIAILVIAIIAMVVTGVIVDTLGSIYGHATYILRNHIKANSEWMYKISNADSLYIGSDHKSIVDDYVTLIEAAKIWKWHKQPWNKETLIMRKAERVESLMIIRILQSTDNRLARYIEGMMYQLRIVRGLWGSIGLIAIEIPLHGLARFASIFFGSLSPESPGVITKDELWHLIMTSGILPLIIMAIIMSLGLSMLVRSHSRFLFHVVAAYYAVTHPAKAK